MGDDRYRLAPVRDARSRDERVRKGELAGAVDDARTTEATLAQLRAATAAARDLLAAAIAQRATVATGAHLLLVERYVARRRRDLADALDRELRAEATHDTRLGAVDAARMGLARARADREVIERHFARWRDARRKLAELRED